MFRSSTLHLILRLQMWHTSQKGLKGVILLVLVDLAKFIKVMCLRGMQRVYKGEGLTVFIDKFFLLIFYLGKLATEDGMKEVAIKEAIGLACEEDFQMLQHEVFLMR